MDYHYFKLKPGTPFAKALKRHFEQRSKWTEVVKELSAHLGEKLTNIGYRTHELWIKADELTKEEDRKLFRADGRLKVNTKRGKELMKFFRELLTRHDLTDFKEVGEIYFIHGAMRYRGENLHSFTDGKEMVYFKASFDLTARCEQAVEPITQIEYEETHLNLLKQKEAAHA